MEPHKGILQSKVKAKAIALAECDVESCRETLKITTDSELMKSIKRGLTGKGVGLEEFKFF